jgi:hypothetical protein
MSPLDYTKKCISGRTFMNSDHFGGIDLFKVILPNHEPTKCSTKRNGIIKAYAANTNQGISRYKT